MKREKVKVENFSKLPFQVVYVILHEFYLFFVETNLSNMKGSLDVYGYFKRDHFRKTFPLFKNYILHDCLPEIMTFLPKTVGNLYFNKKPHLYFHETRYFYSMKNLTKLAYIKIHYNTDLKFLEELQKLDSLFIFYNRFDKVTTSSLLKLPNLNTYYQYVAHPGTYSSSQEIIEGARNFKKEKLQGFCLEFLRDVKETAEFVKLITCNNPTLKVLKLSYCKERFEKSFGNISLKLIVLSNCKFQFHRVLECKSLERLNILNCQYEVDDIKCQVSGVPKNLNNFLVKFHEQEDNDQFMTEFILPLCVLKKSEISEIRIEKIDTFSPGRPYYIQKATYKGVGLSFRAGLRISKATYDALMCTHKIHSLVFDCDITFDYCDSMEHVYDTLEILKFQMPIYSENLKITYKFLESIQQFRSLKCLRLDCSVISVEQDEIEKFREMMQVLKIPDSVRNLTFPVFPNLNVINPNNYMNCTFGNDEDMRLGVFPNLVGYVKKKKNGLEVNLREADFEGIFQNSEDDEKKDEYRKPQRKNFLNCLNLRNVSFLNNTTSLTLSGLYIFRENSKFFKQNFKELKELSMEKCFIEDIVDIFRISTLCKMSFTICHFENSLELEKLAVFPKKLEELNMNQIDFLPQGFLDNVKRLNINSSFTNANY